MIFRAGSRILKIGNPFLVPQAHFSATPKSYTSVDLRGIFIPVPTPFENNEKQAVDYEALCFNIKKWEKSPLKGYCVGGTNGEWPFLKNEEKLTLIQTMKKEASHNKVIIAGSTCESTEQTIELSEAAATAGADAFLIMVPHYFKAKMTETSIIHHYIRVADKVSKPVIIYNNPPATGIDISINAIKILATHPNIIGVKDSDVTKIACITRGTKNDSFNVLAGSAGYLMPAFLMGSSGGINGLAAILGEEICALYSTIVRKDWEMAISLQNRLAVIDNLIMRELGPAGLKVAMDILGFRGGLCRKPLNPLDEGVKTKITETLKLEKFL